MYQSDSSITGYLPIDSKWRDTLVQHGAVPDVDGILTTYDIWCKLLDLNPNILIAQACHEATYFTSDRWKSEWNPAGLGITADNTPPNPFGSFWVGIEAHCQHMCCYVYTKENCPVSHVNTEDRRHVFHDGYPAIEALIRQKDDPRGERRWANPGTGYVDSIVAITNANAGSTSPGGGTEMSFMPTQEGFHHPVRVHLAADVGPNRAISDIDWFVTHDTEGNPVGDEDVLTNPGGAVESAHAQINPDGTVIAMVPLDQTAWTPGNDWVAKKSVNVELSGFSSRGYTQEQYESLSDYYKWCISKGCVIPNTYIGRDDSDGGPLPDHPGIIGHQDVPNPNVPGAWGGVAGHTDPGPKFDWNKLLVMNGGSVVIPDGSLTYRKFEETGHGIDHGFKAWWEADDDPLYHYGFPVTEEIQYGGRTTQIFQRVVVQWFPEFKGTPFEFQTMLLGSDFAARVLGLSGPGIAAIN